jgi:hypothetical protein
VLGIRSREKDYEQPPPSSWARPQHRPSPVFHDCGCPDGLATARGCAHRPLVRDTVALVPMPRVAGQTGSAVAWTHCSAGSNIDDAGGVRGVFVAGVNQANPSDSAAIMEYLSTDPTICGVNLVIPWSAIDQGPGTNPQYNWSFLDQAAAPWEAAGKIVNLIVWGTDEKASEELNGTPATPAYVLSHRHRELPKRRRYSAVLGARLPAAVAGV